MRFYEFAVCTQYVVSLIIDGRTVIMCGEFDTSMLIIMCRK